MGVSIIYPVHLHSLTGSLTLMLCKLLLAEDRKPGHRVDGLSTQAAQTKPQVCSIKSEYNRLAFKGVRLLLQSKCLLSDCWCWFIQLKTLVFTGHFKSVHDGNVIYWTPLLYTSTSQASFFCCLWSPLEHKPSNNTRQAFLSCAIHICIFPLLIVIPIVVTSHQIYVVYLASGFVCGTGGQSSLWSPGYQSALAESIEFHFW